MVFFAARLTPPILHGDSLAFHGKFQEWFDDPKWAAWELGDLKVYLSNWDIGMKSKNFNAWSIFDKLQLCSFIFPFIGFVDTPK